MIIKIAKIKSADKPLVAFQISKETIDELEYGDCRGIKQAIDASEPGTYKLDNNEAGHFGQTAHEGDIVRYDHSSDKTNCPTGWNLWVYGLPVTVKSPTEIYGKVEPRDALFFDNVAEAKTFIQENSSSEYFEKNITITDTEIEIQTSWGLCKGKIGNGFIVMYGKDSFNFLSIGTSTIDEYFIIDEDGNIVKPLNQY